MTAGEMTAGEMIAGEMTAGEMTAGEMAAPETCEVTVTVNFPAGSPEDLPVFIASGQFTPEWTPDDEDEGALVVSGDSATGVITFPNFTNVAYKYTRGTWETVEVNSDCTDLTADRFFFVRCDADEELSVSDVVGQWRGIEGGCP